MSEFELYLPGLLLAYGAFFLGIVSPGPNILAVIGTSMSVGRQQGIALALGVATGSFTWALLTAIGLSALLASYADALSVIRVVGGLYLLYLAFKSFRSACSRHDMAAMNVEASDQSRLRYLMRGYAIQMTNPKAALTWIAIISLGLTDGAPGWVAMAIVGGTFFLSLVIHVLYAVGFSTTVMVGLYGRARRAIEAVLGTFFGLAGARLLLIEAEKAAD